MPHFPADDRIFAPVGHETNTMYERRSLGSVINLSDAHCRQSPTAAQLEIVERLPELFLNAQRRSQLDIEKSFISEFLDLAGEPVPDDTSRILLSYSVSCAITMLASWAARNQARIALLEPAFDNIPAILRREGVDVVSISEEALDGPDLNETLGTLGCDVVWIVMPNNPTGWAPSEEGFRRLADCCRKRGITLVVDLCFRFFSADLERWSQYEVLRESGVRYVVLEDTGKTWSTNELKIGMTVCGPGMFAELYRLHDDLLQAVSPLALLVVTEYIRDARRRGRTAAILERITLNRRLLRQALADAPVSFVTGMDAPVSVDWLLLHPGLDGESITRLAEARDVHVLPGANFYWSCPESGRRYVRVALARTSEVVAEGAALLAEVLRDGAGMQGLPQSG